MGTRKLSNKQLSDMAQFQMRYYAAIRQDKERRREEERKSFMRAMLFFVPVIGILVWWAVLANREPSMYLTERECIKESVHTGAYVGVSPNPLDWKIDGKSCTEYGEET